MVSHELSLKLPPSLRVAFFSFACIILSQFAARCSNLEVGQTDQLSGERVKIRGKIVAVEGENLKVTTHAGDVLVRVPENTRVSGIAAAQLSEITKDSYVGTVAIQQVDGTLRALEVHIFPEEARGTGEGHRPWDLTPDSTMTNANVEQTVAGVDGQMLTVKYKDGEKKILVTPDTVIVTYTTGDKSDLKPGTKIFVAAAKKQPDGTLQTPRITYGKDGLTPPM